MFIKKFNLFLIDISMYFSLIATLLLIGGTRRDAVQSLKTELSDSGISGFHSINSTLAP